MFGTNVNLDSRMNRVHHEQNVAEFWGHKWETSVSDVDTPGSTAASINQIRSFPTLGAQLAGIFRSAVRTPTQLTTNSLTFGSRWLFF